MFLHSGFGRGGRPSFGSWVTYGLGSVNQELPGYVVLLSGPPGGAGTSLWSSGFLPSVHQGISVSQRRRSGAVCPILPGHTVADRRRVLDAVSAADQEHFAQSGDPEIETRIAQYEMAFRMQTSVPELMSLSGESQETLDLYGAIPGKSSFANNCLLARRLVERGVRLELNCTTRIGIVGGIEKRLPEKCLEVDRPMMALITDLKRRGLLQDTLIIWGSEFGRTPLRQGGSSSDRGLSGRDHHKDAFTMWLAGGGVKGGVSHGVTDDLGMDVVENGVHVHDLECYVASFARHRS